MYNKTKYTALLEQLPKNFTESTKDLISVSS